MRIIINYADHTVEYHWMKLWGAKRRVDIDILHSTFYVDKAQSRGGKVDQLTIIDDTDPNNKIRIREIADGFDSHQIWYMHYDLRRVRDEHNSNIAAKE